MWGAAHPEAEQPRRARPQGRKLGRQTPEVPETQEGGLEDEDSTGDTRGNPGG